MEAVDCMGLEEELNMASPTLKLRSRFHHLWDFLRGPPLNPVVAAALELHATYPITYLKEPNMAHDEDLTPETCVEELQKLVGELETKSSRQGQSQEDWLECLEAMSEWLTERTEGYSDELRQEELEEESLEDEEDGEEE
jgi:hypothetical protein